MIGVLPVIAPKVAASFGISLPSVFLGTSIMFVAMGLAAPWRGARLSPLRIACRP